MLKKSFIALCSLIFAFVLIAASDSVAAAGEKYVIKIAHPFAPENSRHKGCIRVKEILEADPNIDFEVQLYPASQLGNETEIVVGMQSNNIEMVVLPWSMLGGYQPLVAMLDLHFLLPQKKESLLKFYQSDALQTLWSTSEEVGIKILDVWHTGYKHFTSNKPITKVADFSGQKLRVQASPIQIRTMEAYGASPVTINLGDTYSALQTGALDGQGDASINSSYDMKFMEVQTNFTYAGYGVLDMIMMASKGWFDGLPANVQQAVVSAVKASAKLVDDDSYRMANIAVENMTKQGVKFHEFSPAEMTELKKRAATVRDFYVSEYGPRAKELLDIIEKEIASLE